MNPGEKHLDAILETIRREFDEGFTRPHETRRNQARRMFLEVTPGPGLGPHLLPLEALAGIQRVAAMIEVAAESPAFVGLVGWRFRPCPVYDLEPMLDPARARNRHEWIAFHDRSGPVGLTFLRLVKVVGLEPENLRSPRADEPHGRFVREIADRDGVSVPVVDVPAIVQEIMSRVASVTPVTQAPDREETA